MKLILNNTINRDLNFLNMRTATRTFKMIMEKEAKESRTRPKNILPKKSDRFFNLLTRDFFKQEIKEKDQDYMHQEIKLIQKYRQNLINKYGKNAPNVILPAKPEPVKYDKKLLFNPIKNENNKRRSSILINYKDIIFKDEKRSNLPKIYLKKNAIKLIKINNGNITIRNPDEKNDQYNISTYNSLNTESSSRNPRNYSIYNRRNNMSKISNSSDSYRFNKKEYLSTLDSLYDETVYNQRRQKKYFNSYNYGYSFQKNKINYIYKTLFNK